MDRITFPRGGEFYQALKQRVDDYFLKNQKSRTGNWKMYVKTAIILLWLVSSYTVLVFFSGSFWIALISAFALAQAFVMVGFNIMHDANHGSYSQRKGINRFMGWSLDLIGGSSHMWRQKHNVLHHTYTNVDSLDDDIDTGGMLRLSPHQPWKPWHRFQRLYVFPLYSLLTLYWLTYTDFKKLFTGRIGSHSMPATNTWDQTFFFLTKIFYFSYTLLIPRFFHPVLYVLLTFLAVHMVTGITMAVVFQLAHTTPANEFPEANLQSGKLPNDWAVHQVRTTADFAPNNPLATWYLGGLNYQIEHHLFSKVCHVHYPALSRIVQKTCEDFDLEYNRYPTIREALAAHWSFLGRMARRPHVRTAMSLAG